MTSDELSTPTILAGQYELVRALGHGSFGHTYLARDRATDRTVAIKLLDPRTTADWKAFERFEREAAVLRSLRHHGIPEVYALLHDEWNGAQAAFLVMEYVEGVSLAQLIDERRQLDAAEVISIFLEQLGILEYLHARVPPVLHRDIKPANIILRPNGLPALVDFGSVRGVFMGPDEAGSTIVGTYGYMPYEQYMGQASPASDLYALGATFLHLLTGRPPRDFMTGEGRIEVPATLPGDARLRPILARLLLPSPVDRFQSARDVRQELLSNPTMVVPADRRDAPLVIKFPSARVRGTPGGTTPAPLLTAVPRALSGNTKQLLDAVAPSAWELMDGSAKPSDTPGLFDYASLVFFSVLTAGVLPIVFINMARTRRRRLRRFFKDGLPAVGEITGIQIEKIAFEATMARVSYQFEADGRLLRDTDSILPVIAGRWQPGDVVPILYLPEFDYDSVIIAPT